MRQHLISLSLTFGNTNSRDNIGLHNSVIHSGSTHDTGVVAPHQESNLDDKVERNHLQNPANETLNDLETAEDEPVSKPLLIILRLGALQGLKSHVERVAVANGIDEKTSGSHGEKEQSRNSDGTHNDKRLLGADLGGSLLNMSIHLGILVKKLVDMSLQY